MFIGGITAGSVATSVWTAATRTLTSIQALATRVSGNPSVAAAAVLDLRPGALKVRMLSAVEAADVSFTMGTYDGATFLAGQNDALGGHVTAVGYGDSVLGFSLRNNTAGAVSVVWCGLDWG